MIEDVEVSWNLSKCFVSACLNAISQVCIQLKISSNLYCSKKSKFLTVWISLFSPPNCSLGLKKAHIRFQQNFVNSWNTNWLTVLSNTNEWCWTMLWLLVVQWSEDVCWLCLDPSVRPLPAEPLCSMFSCQEIQPRGGWVAGHSMNNVTE